MKRLYTASVILVLVITSCATFSAERTDVSWPKLTRNEWEKMTVQRITSILESGEDVSARAPGGFTALMFAAELCSDPEVIGVLADSGCDLNAGTAEGFTALMSAGMNEQTSGMIRSLAEHGADVNTENDYGLTALGIAFLYSPRVENLITLLELESPGFDGGSEVLDDINSRTGRGYNSLMLNLRNGCGLARVAGLVGDGASINARDAAGWSAGTIAAVYNSDPAVLEFLLENSAELNIKSDEGYTTLMLAAAKNQNPEIMRALINHGEDVNAETRSGYTPLMFAAGGAVDERVIRILLDCGADPSAETRDGLTAWDLIQTNKSLKGSRGYWELNDSRY